MSGGGSDREGGGEASSKAPEQVCRLRVGGLAGETACSDPAHSWLHSHSPNTCSAQGPGLADLGDSLVTRNPFLSPHSFSPGAA